MADPTTDNEDNDSRGGPDFTTTDKAALEAAKNAGVNQPSQVSSSGLPGIGELAQRVEALEMRLNSTAHVHVGGALEDEISKRVSDLEAATTAPSTMGGDVWATIDALSALVDHIFNTHFRTVDKAKVIADAAAARDEKPAAQ